MTSAADRPARRRRAVRPFLAASLGALLLLSPATAQEPPPAAPLRERPRFCTDRAARRDLAARGGDEKTEAAVARALAWLAAQQRADGGWSSAPLNGHDTGVTGLALLAFLARAEVPGTEPHGQIVSKGLRFLLSRQRPDGRIGIDVVPKPGPAAPGEIPAVQPIPTGPPTRDVYDHAIAAQALAEAYLLTGRDEYRAPAQAAAEWIQNARSPFHGWRYGYADGDNDTSITGWMVHALWTARAARLDVRERAATNDAIFWLDKVTSPENGVTGYQARGGGQALSRDSQLPATNRHPYRDGAVDSDFGDANTAIDLFVRLLNEQKPREMVTTETKPRNRFDILLAHRPRWSADGRGVDLYSWYWCTLATSQGGGRAWDSWNKALKDALLPNQAPDGSWPPVDLWGRAGRAYSTAMACLCLESYYRFDLIVPAGDRLR